MSSPLICYDLFAGAGGASEGLVAASNFLYGKRPDDLAAVNHNHVAIRTHKRNHPWARHYCEDIKRVDPRKAMGFESAGRHTRRRVRLGIGAPDCTYFSDALGDKPHDDGVRSLAWDCHRWARLLEPEVLLIENVRGFLRWGPLHPADHPDPKLANRPIKERNGEYFRNFIKSIESLGYVTDWRLLTACAYGDPTSRTRLFIQARADGKKIVWPEAEYGPGLRPYRTAREIIDWSLPGESIFTRKIPLKEKTLLRIAEGIIKYCGDPFLMGVGGPRGRQKVKSLDEPLQMLLTRNHEHICVPFLVRYNDGGRVQSLDRPLTTLDTSNRFALCQAFLISYYGNGRAHDLDVPLPTLTTHDRFALVQVQKVLSEKGLAIADIRTRMLQPHEQARAHSFPENYEFEGTQAQITEQVGHSWPNMVADRVIRAALTGEGVN